MAHELDKHQLNRNDFKFVDIFNKGKKTRNWTCLHTDDTFTYTDGDGKTSNDLKGFLDKCMMAKKEGKKTIKEYGYMGTLQQAPDNRWMILQDTERFGIKKTSDGKATVIPDPSKVALGRISQVTGEIVYLKDSIMGLTPYLKITGGRVGNYPYVPLKDSKTDKLVFEPYYAWVIRNEKSFQTENPELLATAKSKMGQDAVASIQTNKYTYAFDAAEAGQVDLETANNELLDDVRYSVSGDTRNLFKVVKNNAPVFVYDKDKNIVVATPRRLERGKKVRGIGKANKKFRYRLPKMLNYEGNLFIPVRYLKKSGNDNYEVKMAARAISIADGKITPLGNPLAVGTVLSGVVTSPVVEKNFSFIILEDSKERTYFMKKNHLEEMLANSDGLDSYELTWGGNQALINSYKDATTSGFEGGDIEDFHGGDVNFAGADRFSKNVSRADLWSGAAGANRFSPSISRADLWSGVVGSKWGSAKQIWNIDGNETVIGFDSNVDIPSDEFDNTEMYFNMDTNEKVLGDFYDNTKIDLSFDGAIFDAESDEETSNAFGDWFKNLFKKKDKKGEAVEVTPEVARELADRNKVEYKPEEVQALYEKSGTNKPFREWLKSGESKQFLNTLSQIGYALLLNKSQGGIAPDKSTSPDAGTYQGGGDYGGGSPSREDKKILGMHPVTFGVVAAVTLLAVGVGVYFIAKKK